MINTVAVGVTLTDPIAILPAKVAGVQLSVEPTGSLSLKASLRVRFFPKPTTPSIWQTHTAAYCKPQTQSYLAMGFQERALRTEVLLCLILAY